MKVAIWANSPSPHQADFYAALRRAGIDLRVLFLAELRSARRQMGWLPNDSLKEGESIIPDKRQPLRSVPDWKERIHVIPGYSRLTHLRAAVQLSRAGAKWVHWSENSMPSWRSCFSWPLKRWYATLVNRCALGAFAQGDCAARDFVSWGIRPTKIAHLYYAVNGVSADQTVDAPTRDFVAGRNAFVYVGTLNHNKASLLLLRAFAESCQDSQTCLVLVGRGPAEQQCRHFVRAHHLERQVFFRGVVPYDQVGSVMRTCRVLVLPSRYDGWGVVMNEGASAGLALVASEAVGAAHQLIQHEQNGFRVKTADTASLAAALAKYAHNHPLAALHGQRSLRLFQESFTPEANVARFVAAVQRWKELPRHPGAFSATAESTPPTQLAADETRRAA